MQQFKVLGAALAGALLETNVVSAAPAEPVPVKPMPISAQIPQDSYGGLKLHLVSNDKGLSPEEAPVYVGAKNELMMPIRVVAEALGYQLAWNQETQSLELVKGSDKGGEIGLNGYGHGVRPNISGDTEIVSADNPKLTLADLQLGMSIEAEHSLVMAMSMPPMTNAIKITVKESPAAQPTLGTAGVIEEVTSSADGTIRLLIKGNKLSDGSFETVVLNVAGDTPIVGTKDNQPVAADQLKKGNKVYAFYGPILTKSLPPIGKAAKIVVENNPVWVWVRVLARHI